MWSRHPSCAPPCPSCTLCTYLYTITLAFNISLTTFMNAFVFTASSSDSYSPPWSGHSPIWQPPWWCCPSPSESNCPPPSNHHPTSLQQPLPTLLSPLASVGPRGLEILKERFFWDTLYDFFRIIWPISMFAPDSLPLKIIRRIPLCLSFGLIIIKYYNWSRIYALRNLHEKFILRRHILC